MLTEEKGVKIILSHYVRFLPLIFSLNRIKIVLFFKIVCITKLNVCICIIEDHDSDGNVLKKCGPFNETFNSLSHFSSWYHSQSFCSQWAPTLRYECVTQNRKSRSKIDIFSNELEACSYMHHALK